MIWLLRNLFWIGLFLISTFAFLVLFDHGTDDYFRNAEKDFKTLKTALMTKPELKKDEKHKADH